MTDPGTSAGVVDRPRVPRPRSAALDNLKVALVAAVIVAHAFIAYGDIGSWAYREPSDSQPFLVVAALAVALGSLFAMGLFFLIGGLLTPRALARKGPAGFLRDRALRLGAPFLVYLLLLYPLVNWLGGQGEHPPGWYLREQLRELDPGPLWFVAVLLLYSVGYVGWRAVRPRGDRRRAFRPRVLVVVAVLIALATLVTRLRFPIDSYQLFALHLWQWPQCLGLFALGVTSAEQQWLDPVPDRVRRVAGWSALVAVIVVVAAFAGSSDDLDPFAGGLTWQAMVTAGAEGAIAVGLGVWLLGHAQRRWNRSGPVGRALARSAFGAYVLQAPVLVALAVAVSAVPVPPEVKFLLVAPAAVAGSFAAAWGLAHVPGVRRVL